ncbi:MAG: site-specific integrase [Phycisphaerae bacterium]
MTRGPIPDGQRYRVRVVTRPERERPFQLDIIDRLTGDRRRETVPDLTNRLAKRDAHKRAEARERDLNERGRGPGDRVPWPEARRRVLELVKAEKRRDTLRSYKRVLDLLEFYAGDTFTCRAGADGRRLRYVRQITPHVAAGFPGWRRGHGVSRGKDRTVQEATIRENTVNCDLRHLRAAWAKLQALGLAAENPWRGVRYLRGFNRQATRLNDRQVAALLHEASGMGTTFHAACALACETGPRIGELSHATWDHLDTANRAWLITEEASGWRPKGTEERMVAFTAETARLLEDYRSSRIAARVGQGLPAETARALVNDARVFGRGHSAGPDAWERTFNADLRRACRQAGVPAVTCHGLRYTVGRRLADAGATPYQVQAVLGHASMQTTLHYIGQDQPGAARAAFEALGRGSRANHVPERVPAAGSGGRGEDGEGDLTTDDDVT